MFIYKILSPVPVAARSKAEYIKFYLNKNAEIVVCGGISTLYLTFIFCFFVQVTPSSFVSRSDRPNVRHLCLVLTGLTSDIPNNVLWGEYF